MKTLLKPIGSGAEIEISAVRLLSKRALRDAHIDILSKTPRTQQERQKVCAILQEVKRRKGLGV